MDYWLIERLAAGATTYNFTLEAETSEAALAAARNLGIEPLKISLYDQPYRLNESDCPWGNS